MEILEMRTEQEWMSKNDDESWLESNGEIKRIHFLVESSRGSSLEHINIITLFFNFIW